MSVRKNIIEYLLLLSMVGSSAAAIAELINKKYEEPVVGSCILLGTNVEVYESVENAIQNRSPKIPCYPYEEGRQIVSAFYDCGGEYKRVDINNEEYIALETQIIEDGGKLVAVLATDPEKQKIEGYYNVSDIKGYDYTQDPNYQKVKTLGN